MKRTLGLTLLLFATLFSCMRQEKPLPAELSRAESVMWEHPDSALSILRSMPQSSLSIGMLLGRYCWHKPGIRYMVNAFRIR